MVLSGDKIENILGPLLLGVVVLSPYRMQDIGLRRVRKLADDAHEPVL
jgi:hypothetical protein